MSERVRDSIGNLPEVKPTFHIPAGFLFEKRYPRFKKTKKMGRIEYEFNMPLGDLLSSLLEHEGRSVSSASRLLKVPRSTIDRWARMLAIEPRRKVKGAA